LTARRRLFGSGDSVLYAPGGDGSGIGRQAVFAPRRMAIRLQSGIIGPVTAPIRYSGNNPETPQPQRGDPTPVVDEFPGLCLDRAKAPSTAQGRGCCRARGSAAGTKIWDSRKVDPDALSDNAPSARVCSTSRLLGQASPCFNAETGDYYWSFEMDAGVGLRRSSLNGRVYICDEKNILWVLQAGKEMKLLSRTRIPTVCITPVVSDGVVYLPTQKALTAYAIRSK
jgi:hypothetical protein